MSDLFDFSKKTDFSYLKGTSDVPASVVPSTSPSPTVAPTAPVARPYMSGTFWQKASDALLTPLNAFGGFLTGTRKASEQLGPQISAGKENIFSAIPKALYSGVKNIPAGITQRISPGTYLKDTVAPSSTGIMKNIASNPVAQFGADITADPLNFLPIEKIVKGLGWLVKKTPIVKDVAQGASDFTKGIGELPVVKNMIEGLGKKFIKGYGLPTDVTTALDKAPLEAGKATEQIIAKQQELFKWGTKEQLTKTDIEAVAKFLEPKGAGLGVDLEALKKSLGTRFTTVIEPILTEERKITKELVLDAAKRGNISSEAAKAYLKGGYFPHNLWEEELKGFSGMGSKIGVKGGYFAERKGVQGFIQNTPQAIAQRQISQVRDNVIQDAIRTIRDKYGKVVEMFGSKVNNASIPDGYRMVTGTHTRLKDLWNVALPNNIADYLDQTLKESGDWQKALDKFNRLWKPTATSMNPGFHLTNMLGNMYNSFLGGVSSPQRFFQMVTGNFTKEETALVDSSGILTRGEFYGNPAKEAFGNVLNKIASSPNKIGGWVENNARKSLFLDAYGKLTEQGLSHEQAMQKAVDTVDKFLFNYQTALTPFENNVMKRFFPFYTWQRSNIPLQLESIYKQTAKPAAVFKGIKALNKGETPSDLSIPTGATDKKGNKLRYKIPVPLQDIQNPVTPTSGRDMLNPIVKAAVSLGNYGLSGFKQAPTDYFTGKELTNTNLPPAEQARDLGGAYASSTIRPVRTVQKIIADPTSGNTIRSLMGGFSAPQSKESQVTTKQRDVSAKESAIKSAIQDAINAGDMEKAKRLEKMLLQ
jgi:hypothetical protein